MTEAEHTSDARVLAGIDISRTATRCSSRSPERYAAAG